ncbi:ribitol-5-phosphate transferase FKTN-like [Biomphalaria glabrata]|uniref:Ribitol-5-phosphate transferase FKTN-like n=1 Tax=Biomphalaria glabrata TaxID=6526 RepID=A0A9W3ACP2_BIOGL|nr:ribitol-5-phosphate transferase FKTN-like [Biomphalaria glabrata]XP_055884912.1 ribitol-5-phosphate transferase FKTN-like [Biomphalaria glabrata]XP_055884913.1 ribitol-5-phosphate transferase FKTN-like [Biomphalaria glabrata]
MLRSQNFILIIPLSLIFLVLQYYGIKYFYDNLSSTTPIEERVPWEAVKLFLSKCEHSGIPVFVIEPSLLRAVREGNRRRVELWNQDYQRSVTFGVIEPGMDLLHLLVSSMSHENYEFWEKNDPDPRGLTIYRRTYRVITTHYMLWVPIQGHTPMLIHLVVFYKRGEYIWHSAGEDRLHKPPFSLSGSPFFSTAGSYSLIDLRAVYIDGVKIQFPNDTFRFLKEIETSEFVECNYTRAYFFYNEYRLDQSKQVELFKRKARQLILLAKQILDSVGVPFWLSSGTCLGWFRQCDLISHTTDVDIGIFITDYREDLIGLLESNGLALIHKFGKVSDSLELSFLFGDIKLDIFFFYTADEYFWNGGTQASTGNKYKYIFPPFKLCWTEFLDLWIRVPCPAAPYILANYGPKWMIPNKKWDWKHSPNNVIENGQWPKEEWDEVIQLYE